jgi:hypothetical protein
MAEKQVAAAQVVRKGVFDLKDFYFHIYTHIKEGLGYGTYNEDDYAQWIGDRGKEIEFHWTFIREQEAYVHFRIWVECKIRGAKEIKTKVGEIVKKIYAGELEFNIKAVLITDPGERWGNHFILKHFRNFYEKYIYKSQIDDYIDRLWEHIYDLEGEVKAFFELPKFS